MPLAITDLIAGVFKPAVELVDDLHTSEEEKLAAKQALLEVQAAAIDNALDYEAKQLAAKASVVEAEAKSEHWVTASWRPIMMLTFLGLIVGEAFGLLHVEQLHEDMWLLLQIGMGGYVGGRSVEKITDAYLSSRRAG